METTSRKSIEHKIKITHPTDLPKIPAMSNDVKDTVKKYLEGPKPENRLFRLRIIYDLADLIIKEIAEDSVCRKGCSWCCAIPVEITPLEARYIAVNSGIKLQKKDYKTISGQEYNVGYCPLLDRKTGLCTVYKYRPFNCRTFLAYDSPEYCKKGFEGEELKHWVTGGPANGYGNKGLLYLALDLIEAEVGQELTLAMKPIIEERIKDIRCYF